jgi:Cys-rich protein (TIGR01571 family)
MVSLKKALSVIVGVGIMVASPFMLGALISPQNLPRRLRGSSGEEVAVINDMKEETAGIEKARAVDQSVKFAKATTELAKPAEADPVLPVLGVGIGQQIVPGFFGIGIVVVFAFFYKQKVVDTIPVLNPVPPSGAPDFKHGMFDCFGDMNTCLFGWCCGTVRVAHTAQVTGVMDFWMAIGAQIASLFCTVCCVPWCLWTYLRMEIKKKLGITPNPAMDFLWTFCCTGCSICQAAREVDEHCGVTVSCPFTVTRGAPGQNTMQGRQMG